MEEKKKSKTWLVILIVLLVGVGVGFGVSKMTSKLAEDDTQIEEPVVDEDEEEEEVIETTPVATEQVEEDDYEKERNDPANAPSTKFTTISTNGVAANYGGGNANARLKRWVGIASTYNHSSGTSTFEKFAGGLNYSQFKKGFKLKMAYNAIFYDKKTKDYTLTASDISKMESTINKVEMKGEPVHVMKTSDFSGEYKGLFQEDTTYNLKDLNFGCPTPWAMDKDTGRIFLFSRCGGTSNFKLTAKITSINSDDSYYYVHQSASIVDMSNNKTVKSYKTLWKFDKNFKFVNTSKE